MRKGRRLDLIISIVVAIFIWGYVVGVVDPTTQERISHVPITYVNTEVLAESGLEVYEPEKPTVTITIKGNRSDVKKVDASKILVTADVSNLKEGSNEVPLVISVPSTVNFVKSDIEEITVNVKKLNADVGDEITEAVPAAE